MADGTVSGLIHKRKFRHTKIYSDIASGRRIVSIHENWKDKEAALDKLFSENMDSIAENNYDFLFEYLEI